ncbi:hypothetical protein QAD02_019853 [Eretmocerus hayati]|uniref:Uncharacterized protein n=1 Tax=Eretmocerus hayati TaxID=131215 RepID=A0ACC2PLZ0_9HYME|nr:hypothetical protein QAD02_019853 [Eretmocerus hayati]
MDLPEYQEGQFSKPKFAIFRVARLVGCIVVVVLLGFSLWRNQVNEVGLRSQGEKIINISNEIRALKSSNQTNHRARRAVDISDLNSFTDSTSGAKDSFSDELIAATTTEKAKSHIQRPNKENYDKLIDKLFDKMYVLRRDSDKKHLRKNIRAVFEAWSEVFDAAVPYEMVDEDVRQRRSILREPSSEESSEEKKKQIRQRRSVIEDPSSEESSEEKKPDKKPIKPKKVKDENNSSVDSSEEIIRTKRSADRSSEEPRESVEDKEKKGSRSEESEKKNEISEESENDQEKKEESSNEATERPESEESLEKKTSAETTLIDEK